VRCALNVSSGRIPTQPDRKPASWPSRATKSHLTEPCSSLDGQRILYTLPDDHGLALGQNVVVEIDWSRRYALIRLHFAAELVLEMICAALPGVERIGAHIAQDKARIAATGSNRRFVAAMSAPDVG